MNVQNAKDREPRMMNNAYSNFVYNTFAPLERTPGRPSKAVDRGDWLRRFLLAVRPRWSVQDQFRVGSDEGTLDQECKGDGPWDRGRGALD